MKRRIDQLLVDRGLFESRSKAAAAIAAGRVRADGRTVARASEQVDETAAIEAEPAHPWVGRGALKLDHALTIWPVAVEGRVVLDVGASTGGFTEVCLVRGARRVIAVDVGRGQLHPKLANDPRVANLESTDARDLTAEMLGEAPGLVVCDASFIGLDKVLARPLDLAASDADLIALVKPQFEAGPARVGKGGLVSDPVVLAEVVAEVTRALEDRGWRVKAVSDSPITGGDGQREFLIHARRTS